MANLPPIPPAADRLLLKPREAAYLPGLLGFSAVQACGKDGVIPYHREGHRLVFFRQELEAYVAALPGVTLEAAHAQQDRLTKMRKTLRVIGDAPTVSPPLSPTCNFCGAVAPSPVSPCASTASISAMGCAPEPQSSSTCMRKYA
jgi:hypothetical protein